MASVTAGKEQTKTREKPSGTRFDTTHRINTRARPKNLPQQTFENAVRRNGSQTFVPPSADVFVGVRFVNRNRVFFS